MHKSKPAEDGGGRWLAAEETRCPKCGSKRVVPILYGYPFGEMQEAADKGEAVLGGCLMSGNDPLKFCLNCETSFDFGEPPLTGLAGYVVSPE